MSKEFLEVLANTIRYKKEYIRNDTYRLYIKKNEMEFLEKELQRLESIDNAEYSEVLKCLKKLGKYELKQDCLVEDLIIYNIIKGYTLKAQEQEKVSEIIKSKKYIPLDKLNPKWWVSKEVYDECVNYKMYLFWCKNYEVVLKSEQILTEKEFDIVKRWIENE